MIIESLGFFMSELISFSSWKLDFIKDIISRHNYNFAFSLFLFYKLTDRSNMLPIDMQAITDERRARQMLEEQVRVIIQVCKKLNHDIEVKNFLTFA